MDGTVMSDLTLSKESLSQVELVDALVLIYLLLHVGHT